MTTTPDHHLAAAREQRATTDVPTTRALLDELSAHLNSLEHAIGELGTKLEPVLTDDPPSGAIVQSRPEARTGLARRLDELSSWANRLGTDVARITERVEL